MQSNTVRFIHARLQGFEIVGGGYAKPVTLQEGGMTFGWHVTDEGNVHVSVPAVCHKEDRYVKKTGNQIAEQNLRDKDALVFISRDELIEDSVNVYSEFLKGVGDLNQATIVQLITNYRAVVSQHPSEMCVHFTPGFFETVVREKLREIYKNQPYVI